MLLGMPFSWLYSQGFKRALDVPARRRCSIRPPFISSARCHPTWPSFGSCDHRVLPCRGHRAALPSKSHRAILAPAAIALAVAVALSRIALGVHWPLTSCWRGRRLALRGTGVTLSNHFRFWERKQGIRAMAAIFGSLSLVLAFQDPGWRTSPALSMAVCALGHHRRGNGLACKSRGHGA